MRYPLGFALLALTLYAIVGCCPAHGAEMPPQCTLPARSVPQDMLARGCPCPDGGACSCVGECKCPGCKCAACPGKAESGKWSQFAGSPDYAFWSEGQYRGRWYAANNTYVPVDGSPETIIGKRDKEAPRAVQAAPYYQVQGTLAQSVSYRGGNCGPGGCH